MIFGLRYNSPMFQVFIVGMICFCCPGMYNALSGIGGQGQSDSYAAANAGIALNVTFTLCSLIGAPVWVLKQQAIYHFIKKY